MKIGIFERLEPLSNWLALTIAGEMRTNQHYREHIL